VGVIKVPLTRGLFAIVDDADAALVLPYKWYACPAPRRVTWYAARKLNGGRQYMHHVICPPPPGRGVDHIDGDGLDNRRENLRPATQKEQTRNRRPQGNKMSSPYKGVRWHSRKTRYRNGGHWEAAITVDGKRIHRSAHSELEAARLYNDLARQHFGEFAWLNPILEAVA